MMFFFPWIGDVVPVGHQTANISFMSAMILIKVKIFDREYLIKSEEDVEQVQKIEKYVNEKLKEIEDAADLFDKMTKKD